MSSVIAAYQDLMRLSIILTILHQCQQSPKYHSEFDPYTFRTFHQPVFCRITGTAAVEDGDNPTNRQDQQALDTSGLPAYLY